MHGLVLIADDFTGAGDSGVTFARSGSRTALVFAASGLSDALRDFDVLAVSSESRFMTAARAADAVRDIAERCRRAGDCRFFKKVDSAMRGNPGAETAALLQALECRAALVCPALPSAGRQVINGNLLVNGQPLHATSLGRDPFTPVASANIRESMADGAGMKTGLIGLDDFAGGQDSLRRRVRALLDDGCRILVADAASDDDLAALGTLLLSTDSPASRPPLLPVGSSGLARAMAGPAVAAAPEPRGRLLAVVGSLDETACRQADHACAEGLFVPVPVDVEAGLHDFARESARVRAEADRAGGAAVLLRGRATPERGQIRLSDGERVAALYGQLAAHLCDGGSFQAVYATGGSTAVAVAGELGLDRLVLEGELLPGVVLGSCAAPGSAVRQFVSKSGSFGDHATLATVASAFCTRHEMHVPNIPEKTL